MSGSIQALDASSIHRITSGQVIVDLQSAVKELVENSLDAGATNIEIRFKDHGATSFEVSDNGNGIEEKDYASVALRGHTSKLSSYEGLSEIESFGFRGEALSSLCQLADVSITTSTETSRGLGTVLAFDRRGALLSSSGRVARAKGTTVSVTNLFSTVPVRRKEFERNSKKHFAQAQNLLQAYGLISSGVRILLSNQVNNKAQVLFRTDGKNIRDNYATLYSAKAALSLLDFELPLEVEAEKRVLKTAGLEGLRTQVVVKGLISKPTAGSGRTSSDRQSYFINGRPFEAKSISKAFNEVYKNFLPSHFPSVVADFHLAPDSYDVNVSPDKRSILLHSEKNLIEALKTALEVFFQPFRSTYTLSSTNLTTLGSVRKVEASAPVPKPTVRATPLEARTRSSSRTIQSERSASSRAGSRDRSASVASSDIDREQEGVPLFRAESELIDEGAGRLGSPPADLVDLSDAEDAIEAGEDVSRSRAGPSRGAEVQTTLDTSGASWNLSRKRSSAEQPLRHGKRRRTGETSSADQQLTMRHFRQDTAGDSVIDLDEDDSESPEDIGSADGSTANEDTELEEVEERPRGRLRRAREEILNGADDANVDVAPSPAESEAKDTPASRAEPAESMPGPPSIGTEVAELDDHMDSGTSEADLVESAEDDAEDEVIVRSDSRKAHSVEQEGLLNLDVNSLRRRLSRRKNGMALPSSQPSSSHQPELDGAGIEQESGVAEKTLSRLVSKSDFETMEVVGQFNAAFIIARRRHLPVSDAADSQTLQQHDDLMIIDQHASDEKYNFERLQLVTRIDSQRLIAPRSLDLPASDELLAIDNIDVLKFNGFEIDVDEEKPTGQRIRLLAMPISKSTKKLEFTYDDFEELLFLLRERMGSGMIRPSKTRKLFAMRACRSSIMVGRVLTHQKMLGVVRNMGTMDQPWNCPHGRNTMRWLTGLTRRDVDGRFRVSPEKLADLLTA